MERGKVEETKYPKEIASVQTKTQTFCINAELTRMSTDNGGEPLKIFSPFSRFIFAIISKETSVMANIPFTQCAGIETKSSYAFFKHMDMMSNPTSKQSNNLSPAYKVKISSGVHKGKTPAEVLIEDENNKISLKNQYIFLKKNLDKYPKNKLQMDAIVDAANLLEKGLLVKDNVVSLQVVDLYDSGPRPLNSRSKDANGNSFVYSISIKWLVGEATPVQITVENYYAPVVRNEDKTINVKVSEKTNSKKSIMNLSVTDWTHCLKMMKMHQEVRANQFSKMCYDEAETLDRKNRQNSRNA